MIINNVYIYEIKTIFMLINVIKIDSYAKIANPYLLLIYLQLLLFFIV